MTNQEAAATTDEQFVVVDKKDADTKDSTKEPSPTNDNEAAANNNDAEEAAMDIPPEIFLKGLTILSPRQKKDHKQAAVAVSVPLPPLRPEEPVASIRSAISEIIGFAHLTKYRLILERTTTTSSSITSTTAANGSSKKSSKNKVAAAANKNLNGSSSINGEHKDWEADNVVSTYTLDGAEMATDKLVQSLKLGRAPEVIVGQDNSTTTTTSISGQDEELELDDYGDLSTLLEVLEKEGKVGDPIDHKIIIDASNFAFRVVLERYDAASIRDHMVRVRQLLEGNAPHLVTLMGDEEVMEVKEVVEKKEEQIVKKDGSDNGGGDDKVSLIPIYVIILQLYCHWYIHILT
jgi:protein TIF31